MGAGWHQAGSPLKIVWAKDLYEQGVGHRSSKAVRQPVAQPAPTRVPRCHRAACPSGGVRGSELGAFRRVILRAILELGG